MIISFSIENFKCVKEKATLSFEPENSDNLEDYYIIEPLPGVKLLKLGLIYGPNGSGKTTILRSLDFLRRLVMNPLEQKHDTLDFSPFLFDEETPTAKSSLEISFIHNAKYTYKVEFNPYAILYEKLEAYTPNKSLVYERTTDIDRQLSMIRLGGKIKIKKAALSALEAVTLWNTTVLSSFLKTNIDSKELKDATDWFNEVLNRIVVPSTDLIGYISERLLSKEINKKNVLQFLKKADFKITDISVEKKEFSIHDFNKSIQIPRYFKGKILSFKLKDDKTREFESTEINFQHSIQNKNKASKYIVSYEDESEGTQRYFQLSGLLDLMLRRPNVLPIDELESSLHPDLLKHFLLIFLVNIKTSQLIATTHYRELLLERDIIRDDVIWFTEKRKNGSIDLYSLSDFDSSVVRDTTSIFNAYRSGKLGAVPELGDYYLDLKNGEK